MALKLRITNVANLADGGPISYSLDSGGFEFGRDPAMDWTLPDPQRFVSSCHGEIRFENGGYWLHDHSTNGTFLNGATSRVKSPYALQKGDRLQVGTYILLVEDASAAAGAAAPGPFDLPSAEPPPAASSNDIWSLGGAAPDPVAGFDPTPPPPRRPDFGDEHLEIGGFGSPVQQPTPAPAPIAAKPAGGDASPFGPPPTPDPAPPPPTQPEPAPAPSAKSPFATGGSPFDTDTPPQAAKPSPFEDTSSPFDVGAGSTPPPPKPAPDIPASPRPAPTPEPPAPRQPEARPAPMPEARPAPMPGPRPVDDPPAPAPGRPSLDAGAGAAFGAPPPRHAARPVMETPAPEPVPVPPPPPTGANAGADASALLKTICQGAGLSPDAFAGPDPHATAHEIGRALRIMTAELAALLRVRTTIKTSFRSGSRTEMSAEANNPLKFVPTAEEALEIMFGRPRPGYQRGAETVQSSFSDINRHQMAVFAAIQPALAELIDDLAPDTIEKKVEGGAFTSKSARAWDLFVERWDAKTEPHENGMLDVFNLYFARAYDAEINRSKK